MDCLIFHDLFQTFLSENDFCTITPYLKMFCKFSLELTVAKHKHVFIALCVLKPREKSKLVENKFARVFLEVVKNLAF